MIRNLDEINDIIKANKEEKSEPYILVYTTIDENFAKNIFVEINNSFIDDQDYIDDNIVLSDCFQRDGLFQVYLYIFSSKCMKQISIDKLRCISIHDLDGLKSVKILNTEYAPNVVKDYITLKNFTINCKELIDRHKIRKITFDDLFVSEELKPWVEIYKRSPEFANFIIDFYEEYDQEGLNDLIIMYNTDKKKFELGSKTPAPSSEAKEE